MRLFWMVLLLFVCAWAAPLWGANPGDVVITEIMQNPNEVSDTYGEWLELYNRTGAAIDIDGWTIGDGQSEEHVIDGGGALVIGPGGFLVLGRNDDFSVNGGYNCDYQYSGMTLGNGEDRVVLRAGSVTVDSVYYDDGDTFPDPTGASMECIDPEANNNTGSNWQECVISTYGDGDYGTPGDPNDPWGASTNYPQFFATSHEPAFPSSADTVLVSAQVTDDEGLLVVGLYYRLDGGVYQMVSMIETGGNWYEGLIPPAPVGTAVEYYLCATDTDTLTTWEPEGAPVTLYGYTVEDGLPMVVINEILASPQQDANNDGLIEAYEDEFVELYNAGGASVDLSGWTLSDDDATASAFAFPEGTVVEPGGFITLFGGGAPTGFVGPVFTDDGRIGNGLSNTGDTVELRRDGELIDQYTYGSEANHGESLIRLPDGYGDWTRPSLEGFDWNFSPQASNGATANWVTGKSWGAIKRLFHD
ncbi:MAG: lamin tail domain-containing protein [Candidatus Eisenbacteria bacterium]|nr:lamin tail domain-containing protein [Candidatus Eisenbacteria bacterium]